MKWINKKDIATSKIRVFKILNTEVIIIIIIIVIIA